MENSSVKEPQIKEMITQLKILKTKQEGYGMSFHNPQRGNGTPSLNLYGDRAKSAIWLFTNAETIAQALETLLEERREDHANINLKADFIEASINDLAQKDQDTQKLTDFIKTNENDEIVDYLPAQLGKIIWNENPLKSVVELTDLGKHYLKLKVIIQEQEEWMGQGHYVLSKGDLTLDKAKDTAKILDLEFVERRVEYVLGWHLNALGGGHCGDCTCLPASCPKCHVERLLGISTTKGLSKYAGSAISREFAEHSNIDEVIIALRDYVPHANWAGWEAHAKRWKAQATDAYEWLVSYKQRHFPKISNHSDHPDRLWLESNATENNR